MVVKSIDELMWCAKEVAKKRASSKAGIYCSTDVLGIMYHRELDTVLKHIKNMLKNGDIVCENKNKKSLKVQKK